ncbi:hypothetical protein N8017_00295 [Crocinitomicaceae bacterium]|mgnify:FL=1|nr:hypothetical protein [Crocinitomicaceae bacterium]MDC1244369.1 hypothetical protein [Crocinitomicaceae bacterium]
MMKKLTLLLIIFSMNEPLEAQVYMRTHKNFGVYGQLNTSDFDKNGSYSFQTGITRQFGRYVLPEFGYRQMIQKDNTRFIELNEPIREHFLTTAMIFRAPLVVINERKKGRSCRGEVLEIFCGPEVFYRLNGADGVKENLSTSIKGGLGIFHVRTGHSKRSKAWTVKLEAYYRHQFENPINEFHIPNEFGLQIRLLRYKVYDFVRN